MLWLGCRQPRNSGALYLCRGSLGLPAHGGFVDIAGAFSNRVPGVAMSGSTCVFGPGYLALRAVAILPAVCTTPVMQAAAAVALALAMQMDCEMMV